LNYTRVFKEDYSDARNGCQVGVKFLLIDSNKINSV
jgi:hypothetical protein